MTSDGKRIGKWNFYNSQQELELTFDYDSSRVNFIKEDTTQYLVRVGEQWERKRVNRPPHVLGSTENHMMALNRLIRYPASALVRQLQGIVVMSYTVTPEGHTTDFTIENSLSRDCDQEVFKTFQASPDIWIPAIYRGKPTAARYYLMVRFRIIEGEEAKRLLAESRSRSRKTDADVTATQSVVVHSPYVHEVVVTALGIERAVRYSR